MRAPRKKRKPSQKGDSGGKVRYMLRLYVTGTRPQSIRAITNIKAICEDKLKDNYSLEVVDMYQQPHLLSNQQIFAAPTLVKSKPLPERRLVGDMSNQQRVINGLDIKGRKT